MKKFAPVAIFIAILAAISVISVFEIYNTWDSREIYFKEEPQFILRNVVHILLISDYIVITYAKNNLLVKERLRLKDALLSPLIAEKAEGDETYVEIFPGLREPMLWLKDSESDPPALKIKVYCGANIAGLDLCNSFKNN